MKENGESKHCTFDFTVYIRSSKNLFKFIFLERHHTRLHVFRRSRGKGVLGPLYGIYQDRAFIIGSYRLVQATNSFWVLCSRCPDNADIKHF